MNCCPALAFYVAEKAVMRYVSLAAKTIVITKLLAALVVRFDCPNLAIHISAAVA